MLQSDNLFVVGWPLNDAVGIETNSDGSGRRVMYCPDIWEEGLRKTKKHLRRDRALSIDQLVQLLFENKVVPVLI
jgi:hypothetical protein